VSKLKSEFEIECPCCSAKLVVDANLHRVIRHSEPPSADRPELDHAQRIVAEQAARREALFQKSVAEERTRGDALSKRFEEALKQANEEPITKPTRDFDLD
jgi:GTP cyclohydrolase FolE2